MSNPVSHDVGVGIEKVADYLLSAKVDPIKLGRLFEKCDTDGGDRIVRRDGCEALPHNHAVLRRG